MTPGTSTPQGSVLRHLADLLDAQAVRRDSWGTRKGTRQAWHLRAIAAGYRLKAERAERAEGET